MATAEKELEEQLVEAGNKLLKPPAAIEELLTLLDQVENCLARVEQSPSKTMLNALHPSMKALIAGELLKHSDEDVKVAVASCISEITRITAPDAPYDDDIMKEIFQMIVTAFENLSDMSSRSYSKRVSILETVAKVRSCVVMLDLECDALILEMFHHFLKAIRDGHPDNVFSSMETIMTLVLEESEEISSELLSCLLSSVKDDNEDLLPVAQRLGEKVIANCAAKLKPFLVQEVQSKSISLGNYSKVVASVCQEISDALEQSDVTASAHHLANEIKVSDPNEPLQEAVKMDAEAACPGEVDPAVVKSPTSVMSNGTAQTENDDLLADPNSQNKKGEHSRRSTQPKTFVAAAKEETDQVGSPRTTKPENMLEQATRKTRGRKINSLLQSVESSDYSRSGSEKEPAELTDGKNVPTELADGKNVPTKEGRPSQSEGLSMKEETAAVENEKKTEFSSPTGSHNETQSVASQSPSQSLHETIRPKRGRPGTKKRAAESAEAEHPSTPREQKGRLLSGDEAPESTLIKSKKEAEGNMNVEAKIRKRSGKKVHSTNEVTPSKDVSSRKESEGISDSEAKTPRHPGKKVADAVDGGSSKQQGTKTKRHKGVLDAAKGAAQESGQKKIVASLKPAIKSSVDDKSPLEETSKSKSKRKRASATEEASKTPRAKDLDGSLVGSHVKVWWPDDKKFYKGRVESFDEATKKHRIVYYDGDEEVLQLEDERWEFIKSDTVSNVDEADPTNDESSEMPPKKKNKRNSDSSAKQENAGTPLKRGPATSTGKTKDGSSNSTGKAKGSAAKSSSKSRTDTSKSGNESKDKLGSESKDSKVKTSSKSKDDNLKAGGKSKDDTSSKSKDEMHKNVTKAKDDAAKTATKSKDETPKAGTKQKEETPKSKVELLKSGGKTNVNGASGKGKSSSSKLEKSDDSAKGKLSSGKAQENKIQKGKKLRRQQ